MGLGLAGGCSDDEEKAPSFSPTRGCAGFTRGECLADDACEVVEARALRAGELLFVGCRDADEVCEAVEGCGFPATGVGACRYFQSSCVPTGWRWDAECDGRPDCEVFITAGGAGGAGGGP